MECTGFGQYTRLQGLGQEAMASHVFWGPGYIDRRVWESWYRGMKVFFKHPRIKALWEEDCKADSYYGFRPPQ
jgi:hypothetical protein